MTDLVDTLDTVYPTHPIVQDAKKEIVHLRKQLVSKTEALRKIADGDWGYISPEYATDKSRIRCDIAPGNNIPYMGTWAVIARSALTDETRPIHCPNGLEHGACLHPNCVVSCPGRLSLSDEKGKDE